MTAHDLKLACPAYKMQNSGGICEKCKNGNLLHVLLNRCIHDSYPVSALVMVESSIHKLLRLYSKNLNRVVVPSKFYGEKLVDWGWSPEQIKYIPNYVEIDNYEPEYSAGDSIVYFGRLAPVKGIDTLIRAASAADVKVRIAGTGPQEQELKKLAATQSAQVEFLGYRAGNDLHQLIQSARAVVLPSEWYENAPISVLEAYGCGKIVVGARIGGIPEMVIEDETGYLFESGNVVELTEVLKRVKSLADDTIESMGKRAREYLAANFTRERYRSDMLQLYSELGVKVPVSA